VLISFKVKGFPADFGDNAYQAKLKQSRSLFLFPGSTDLIGKLLRKRPEDRLPLKDVLQHAWITSGGGGQH
jgi:hypothetical protein